MCAPSNEAWYLTGGRELQDCEQDGISISLKQILAFSTGADAIPPLGFPHSPLILFSKDRSRLLPVSSTCALSLTLSLGLVDYAVFKSNMDTAVLNAYEFGNVGVHYNIIGIARALLYTRDIRVTITRPITRSRELTMADIFQFLKKTVCSKMLTKNKHSET